MTTVRDASAAPTHWVTIREACDLMGVSDDTIRRRIRDGLLPARKEATPSGTRWMVELSACETADAEPTGHISSADALPTHAEVVTALQQVIDNLERERAEYLTQLRTREREVAELHILLQQTHRQTAALPPPQDYRSEATDQDVPIAQYPRTSEPPSEQRLPWWRRLLAALTDAP